MMKKSVSSVKRRCAALRSRCLLQVLDHQWKETLGSDGLFAPGDSFARAMRKRIRSRNTSAKHLSSFTSMLDQIKRESVRVLTAVQVPSKEEIEAQEEARRQQAVEQLARAQATHDETTAVD